MPRDLLRREVELQKRTDKDPNAPLECERLGLDVPAQGHPFPRWPARDLVWQSSQACASERTPNGGCGLDATGSRNGYTPMDTGMDEHDSVANRLTATA